MIIIHCHVILAQDQETSDQIIEKDLKQSNSTLAQSSNEQINNNINNDGTLEKYDTEIKINAKKDIYCVLEDIYIHVKIINNDEEGPSISGMINQKLIVKNSKDYRYKPMISSTYLYTPPMGKGIEEYYVDVLAYYGKIGPDPIGLYRYLPSDTYAIYCIWENNGYEPLISNIINIEIKEPVGDNLKAFNIYVEAEKFFKMKEYNKSEKKFEEIYKNYPQGIYTVKALNRQLFIYKFAQRDPQKYFQTSKLIIEKYPDSYHAKYALNDVVQGYQIYIKDIESGKKYLKNLYQNTQSVKLKKLISEKMIEIDEVETQ
jgi:hypothetical protein